MPNPAPIPDRDSTAAPSSNRDASSTPDPPEVPAVSARLLADLEEVERAAFVDMVEGAPEPLRRRLGLQVERRGGMVAIRSSGLDTLMFNRLFVPPAGEVERADLEALVRGYAMSGIGRYLVHIPPSRFATRVAAWLEAQSIEPFRRHWVKFVRGAEPAARRTTDLIVRPAEARDAERYGAILTAAFQIPDAAIPLMAGVIGRPGWHAYVACDGQTPVASAALFVRGRMASLAGAATLPSHQRRGAQGALLAARIDVARRAGAEHICSETGVRVQGEANGSYRNMVRIGLQPVYLRRNYAPRGTTWAPT